jgi:hypothetical protein
MLDHIVWLIRQLSLAEALTMVVIVVEGEGM